MSNAADKSNNNRNTLSPLSNNSKMSSVIVSSAVAVLLVRFVSRLSCPCHHKDMIFEILYLLLKVMRCDIVSAKVISTQAITGIHAGCSMKFGVIEAG